MSAQPQRDEAAGLFEFTRQTPRPASDGLPRSRLALLSLMPTRMLLVMLCAAAIVIGWALLLASLLYVLADYSTTVWLLTTLGLAIAHGVLALACWHYACQTSSA